MRFVSLYEILNRLLRLRLDVSLANTQRAIMPVEKTGIIGSPAGPPGCRAGAGWFLSGVVVVIMSEKTDPGSETNMIRRLIPLANFVSEIDRYEFPNGYLLEPLGPDEHAIIRTTPLMAQNYSFYIGPPEYKLVNQDESPISTEIEKPVEIIRAMRLCHAGDICAPIYVDLYSDSRGWTMGGFSRHITAGSPYQLRKQDIPAIDRFVKLLSEPHCRANHRLENALTRFDDVHARNRLDEEIIDCFIALESCLTPDQSSELAYRLQFRTAALLAQERDPVDVQLLVAAGYDARSKIVHRRHVHGTDL
jgi:Apea-like HEPN